MMHELSELKGIGGTTAGMEVYMKDKRRIPSAAHVCMSTCTVKKGADLHIKSCA